MNKIELYKAKLKAWKISFDIVINKLKAHPEVFKELEERKFFIRVKEQIEIWEKYFDFYVEKNEISISAFELFRYFVGGDNILDDFINSYYLIEGHLLNANQKKEWKSALSQLVSSNVSQIYSTLFEVLLLGKLLQTGKLVEIYFENIDGRMKIEDRFIYFDIKALQKTKYDLDGTGTRSTEYDQRQIYRAIKEKNSQLYGFRKNPCLVFLSLYMLADPTTSDWYIPEYFVESPEALGVDNKILGGIKLYTWFTATGNSQFYNNTNAACPLSHQEVDFLENVI